MILDNDLVLDRNTGRYYLTETYVYNEMGTDIALLQNDELDTHKETLVKRNIKYACDMIYDFIDDNAVSPQSTYYYVTWNKLAHNSIKRALELQVFDFLQKGDSSMEDGGKVAINSRAIQTLNANSCFHVVARDIPEITEW